MELAGVEIPSYGESRRNTWICWALPSSKSLLPNVKSDNFVRHVAIFITQSTLACEPRLLAILGSFLAVAFRCFLPPVLPDPPYRNYKNGYRSSTSPVYPETVWNSPFLWIICFTKVEETGAEEGLAKQLSNSEVFKEYMDSLPKMWMGGTSLSPQRWFSLLNYYDLKLSPG